MKYRIVEVTRSDGHKYYYIKSKKWWRPWIAMRYSGFDTAIITYDALQEVEERKKHLEKGRDYTFKKTIL